MDISFKISNSKIKEGNFVRSDDFMDRIFENRYFSEDDQLMVFDCDGLSISVNFSLHVSGDVSHDPGDYYTEPFSEVYITDVDIDITEVLIDEYEVELTEDLIKLFQNLVKYNL